MQINGAEQVKANSIGASQVASSVIVAGGGNPFTGNQSLGGFLLNNVGAPVASTDAATKGYVDNAIQGLDQKPTARVATTAALPAGTYSNGASGVGATFTVTATGTLTIDGVVTALGDVILVKNQASAFQNGLYTVTTAGASGVAAVLTRSVDMNTGAEFEGALVPVDNEGTANANTLWLANNVEAGITVGTTAITFVQLAAPTSYVGDGTTITISGTTISIYSGYVGQSSITTLGTIATGVWHGTLVGTSYGGTGVASVTIAPTASAFAGWDANKNLSANSFIESWTTIATAAGTTTLTVSSTEQQFFTGATTQTVLLPVASTLVQGQQFTITNLSTGVVTVQSSGGNTILAMPGGTTAVFTCIITSGTTAASWSASYEGFTGLTGTGSVVLSTSPTLVTPALGTPASGVLTNCTGTASGLTAGNVTTNANLTGPVTSVGNATTIAAAAIGPTQLAAQATGTGLQGGNGSNLSIKVATRETPSGTINGSNTSFTLANTPVSGTEMLFLNGILQRAGAGNDYTISGLTITYNTAPQSGDTLLCTYFY